MKNLLVLPILLLAAAAWGAVYPVTETSSSSSPRLSDRTAVASSSTTSTVGSARSTVEATTTNAVEPTTTSAVEPTATSTVASIATSTVGSASDIVGASSGGQTWYVNGAG